MSLQQANAFYEVLTSDESIYQQYYQKCSHRGFFGIWNWDKTKIVNFAASFGYDFTENELDEIWFENDVCFPQNSLNLSEYGQLS